MVNYHILLTGPDAPFDQDLVALLKKFSCVIKNSDNKQVESILNKEKVDLIIFEVTHQKRLDLGFIKKIRNKYSTVPILLIDGNGDTDLIVNAYTSGVKDVFKKPYKCYLIAERANALVSQPNR